MAFAFVVVPESFRRAYEKPPNSSATGGFDPTGTGPCANAGVAANSRMAITDRGFFMFAFPSMQAPRCDGLSQRTAPPGDGHSPKMRGGGVESNRRPKTGCRK